MMAWCWRRAGRTCGASSTKLHAAGSSVIGSQTMAQMAPLWATEEAVRGQVPAVRRAARQEKSAAVVAALFALWKRNCPKLKLPALNGLSCSLTLGKRLSGEVQVAG